MSRVLWRFEADAILNAAPTLDAQGNASAARHPSPVEALPWGSMSITRHRYPALAIPAPRLIAVVVLPTPPF